MARLVIHFSGYTPQAPCGVCGKLAAHAAGPQLCLAQSLAPVCPGCGETWAPRLMKLIHLAYVAERVGKISRHTLAPSFGALLDLASAAEDFASAPFQEELSNSDSESRKS